MDYVLHIAVIIGIYIIINQGLNLLTGFAGVVSVMQFTFCGIGAYFAALLALRFNFPIFVTLPAAALAAGVAGWVLGRIISRFDDDYIALITFALALIFYDIFDNWLAVTNGPMGIRGIPQPFETKFAWFIFTYALVALCVAFVYLIAVSPFGRLLKSVRDDELLVAALGRDPRSVKAVAFAVSATLAGISGAVYAHYVTYINPKTFAVRESVTLLTMIIIGGLESVRGAIAGAVLLIVFPELLRFVGLPSDVAAGLRQLLFGLFLIVVMTVRPRGIFGKYEMR